LSLAAPQAHHLKERKMKTSPRILAALFAATAAHAGLAAEPAASINALFRVVKADGNTPVGQAVVIAGFTPQSVITVNQADALVAANGRCAFNVKYDEVSSAALTGTVNRLYSNDTLVAQNSAIDLQAKVARTVWTQPYLFAGVNNVKLVFNANSPKPVVGWVRVNVVGACNALPTALPPAPAPAPAAPPVLAGSADWNALYNAWGYSNYATAQLKTKNFARYAAVMELNAALSAAVRAGRIERAAYSALMARWAALANDAAFKAAMALVVPGPAGK
jgi:hypothetical protein